MDSLLLDPLSRQHIERYIAAPSHALLLEGEQGVGLMTITAQVIAKQLTKHAESTMLVTPEKGTISIDTVRGLYASTRSSRSDAMAVIIDDADSMGSDAQNALLKLLEEPPRHIHFILTSHSSQQLLDTIMSRTERITVRLASRELCDEYITKQGVTDATTEAKLLFLASGKPAELSRLINDEAYYNRWTERMGDAKQFLGQDPYERLILLKKYMSDREEAEAFLIMTGQLISHGLYRTVSDSSIRTLEAVNKTLDALSKNGNVRAQLLALTDALS